MSREFEEQAEDISPPLSFTPVPSRLLQRTCACGGVPGVDGECDECRSKQLSLQRSATNPDTFPLAIPPVVHEVLRSPGQPLDASMRAFMEPRFGHDFSQVRIHSDTRATESARAVNALAYTVGKNVVFGAGQYAPGTTEGQRLVGHELTHVVQQDKGMGIVSPLAIRPIADSAELEADHLAHIMTSSIQSPVSPAQKVTSTAHRVLQRQPASSPLSQAEMTTDDVQIEKDLDSDFHFIMKKLDVLYYSESDEAEVFAILNKWAHIPNPPQSRPRRGSRYLEQLFMKLQRKDKDVGILTEQKSNYYSQLFSRSSRLNELRMLRDTYAPLYVQDEGVREISFGSVLWENVEKGVVRDQIFAYGKGLAKGVYAGGKGLVKSIIHPIETGKNIYQAIANFDKTKAGIKKLASEYWATAGRDPIKFAEMTGELVGQVEVALASTKGAGLVGSAIPRVAGAAQRWARIGLVGATLGVGQVVPKIGGGSAFVSSAARIGTVVRAAEVSQQVTSKAAALPTIQKAAKFAQEATQVVEDVTGAAEQAAQATQASANIAATTASTISTASPIATQTTASVLGNALQIARVTPVAAQVANQIVAAEQTLKLQALSAEELYMQGVQSTRGFVSSPPGAPTNLPTSSVGKGYETFAAIQIIDKEGNQVLTSIGAYLGGGQAHGEIQAIAALQNHLPAKIAGGVMMVVVEQAPCPGCASSLEELANKLGLKLKIYVPRRPSKVGTGQVKPKTAATTSFRPGNKPDLEPL